MGDYDDVWSLIALVGSLYLFCKAVVVVFG